MSESISHHFPSSRFHTLLTVSLLRTELDLYFSQPVIITDTIHQIHPCICPSGHMVAFNFLTPCMWSGPMFDQWIISRSNGSHTADRVFSYWFDTLQGLFPSVNGNIQDGGYLMTQDGQPESLQNTMRRALHWSMMDTQNEWHINLCWFTLLRFWGYLLLLHNSAHPDWCTDIYPVLDTVGNRSRLFINT